MEDRQADREKVIKALEDAEVTNGVIKMSDQFRDVLVALLKEQEAREKNRLPYSPDSNVQWT